jgi:hypothetical protein
MSSKRDLVVEAGAKAKSLHTTDIKRKLCN